MARRSLTVLAAAAVATASLVALAPAASAATTCNTTNDPYFDLTVCLETNGIIAGYISVPYSVGSVCVAGTCTPAYSGTVPVPVPNVNAYVVSGTLCVKRFVYRCQSFSTYIYPISIG